MTRHVDVLIIGAGLSGIGMACHLTRAQTADEDVALPLRKPVADVKRHA